MVARVNADLNATGLYDEFVFSQTQPAAAGGRGQGPGRLPLFVAELTKDVDNVPPRVRLCDRLAAAAIAAVASEVPTIETTGGVGGDERGREKANNEEEEESTEMETDTDTDTKTKPEPDTAQEEEEEEEQQAQDRVVDSPHLQSRQNLPSVYIQSLCRHGQLRLLTIDKATRRSTGVSTYIFEKQ